MSDSRKNLRQSPLGPWTIRPWPIASLMGIFGFTVTTIMLAANRHVDESSALFRGAALEAIFPNLMLFGFLLVSLKILSAIQKLGPCAFATAFFASVVWIAVTIVSARLVWIPERPPLQWTEPRSAVVAFVFSLFFNWFMQASIGYNEFRLRAEIVRTQQALEQVEAQRAKLVEAQEQVRNQIADFLHDNLQSRLVVLGLQMRKFIETLPKNRSAVANSLLGEVERIRSLDVRGAARVLRPELEAVSLNGPLTQLAANYQDVMSIVLQLDDEAASPWLPERVKLATYRIVEQALLNAAAHGKAKTVNIKIWLHSEKLQIEVINDGVKPGHDIVSGAGFAVIQSWVELFAGQWSLAPDQKGVALKASLDLSRLRDSNP